MRNSITARDTRHISLTIYNGGFGSVNEHRTIDIKQGQTEIIYADVAKKIRSIVEEGEEEAAELEKFNSSKK